MAQRPFFDMTAGATFLEVAREGSIRKAAERMHIATSAVSRQMARLERGIGKPLLERRPGGVALTPAGAVFRAHMIEVLARVDQLRDAVDSGEAGVAAIRLATVEGITRDFLSDLIAEATAARPGLAFSVDVRPRDQVFDALEAYEAEIGFIYDHFTHPAIEPVGLWRQPLFALAPAGHPLALRAAGLAPGGENGRGAGGAPGPLTIPDLAGATCVLPDDSFGISRLVRRAFRREGLAPQVVLTSNQLHFLTVHALRTGALLFAPVRAVMDDLREGRLVPLPLDCPMFDHRHVSAAIRRGRPLTAPAAGFLDRAVAAFAAAEAEDAAVLAAARARLAAGTGAGPRSQAAPQA